jgi:hypothetical protein
VVRCGSTHALAQPNCGEPAITSIALKRATADKCVKNAHLEKSIAFRQATVDKCVKNAHLEKSIALRQATADKCVKNAHLECP